MKRALPLLPLLSVLLAADPVLAKAGESVTIVADTWCPYNCKPGSERPGVGIELAKRIFEPKGIRVDYRTMEWDRAVKETRAGAHDAVVGAYRSDLPDFVYPSEPIALSQMALFVRKGDPWRYSGPRSLSGRKLGVIAAYTYGEPFDSWIKSGAGVSATSGDEALDANIKRLLDGAIDTIVDDRNVFQLRTRALYVADKLVEAGGPKKDIALFVAFSPKRPGSARFAQIFTDGVAELRRSGELTAILHRYGMRDWK